ncbi:sugar ABC transporter substrate-binding protein [Bacteroidia bacterium]|nr:sugar ABC transporter substrate-binding protein [Bacteroidia bacterium]
MRKMKRILVSVLCIGMMAATLAACGGTKNASGGDQTEGKKSYKIGLSQEGLDHSYMITQKDQIIAAAKAYADADVEVICTDGQNQTAQQVKGIEDMLVQGIDLLMVQAAEGEGLKSALASAEEKGVPYMFVGKPVNGTKATTMVNNDNYEIGKNAGEWTVNYLKEKNGSEKGNVVIVAGIPGDQSAEDRVNGFLEITDQFEGIKIVANIPANYRRQEAFKVTQDILQANAAGTIDCLYGANGETSLGAAQAITDAGRKGEFPVLSVDGDVASIEAIKNDEITAAWTYEPCGTSGFEYAMKILNGETVEPAVIIPSRIIDKNNVNEAEPAF